VSDEKFHELVALSKLMHDYRGEGEEVAPQDTLDQEMGVAVEVRLCFSFVVLGGGGGKPRRGEGGRGLGVVQQCVMFQGAGEGMRGSLAVVEGWRGSSGRMAGMCSSTHREGG
jgi:hypothetical protein